MGKVSDTTIAAVRVESFIIIVLRAHPGAETVGRCACVNSLSLLRNIRTINAICVNLLSQRHSVHSLERAVHKTPFCKFVHNGDNPACPVHILNVIFVGVGGHLAQARHLAGKCINVRHLEVRSGFICNCKEMKHGIGRTAHSYIQGHCIEESSAGGYRTWQHGFVPIPVVFVCIADHQTGGLAEEFYSPTMGSDNSAVTWE